MKSNASSEGIEGDRPRRCPACGTPYPAHKDDLGCPVCLLLQAAQPEATIKDEPTEGRFDHYELVRRQDGSFEELGRGAMGVTYKAFDTVLQHPVALKIIDSQIAADPNVRQRFLREARAAARLRHQNVASVFYYGTRKSDGQCFYSMELVEGETLEAHLRRLGQLPPALALEVVAQVARALVAAEAHGLVHRDIKPANLMVVQGPELTVKVIDFGLAKATTVDESNFTHGGFVGTPAFASPEQFTGVSVDIRSDLYSVGVVLWEMLTGHSVFRGSPVEVMYQQQHLSLPFEQLEGIPQPIVTLLEVLLDKEPVRRFRNPAELLKAIPTIVAAIETRRRITRKILQKTPSTVSRVGTRKPPAKHGPKKISVAGLPITASDVFGREEDIVFLDDAWANQGVNVVTIVAWAGVGKSTLVNHWLRRMAADHYRSAELIFGWSFYRQGTGGDTSSADEFLDSALTWFGDPDPRLGTAWEKGERLAKLVAHRRTLLILDGLEPLQNPPGPQEGRLREPSLQALLRELAAFNTGLCVITTRTPIADIASHQRSSALRRDLDQLSKDAGAKLLRGLGVRGHDTELRSASDEFGGHCLALTLLGSYLTDAYEGDIRCRDEVSNRLAHDIRQGTHARKVMDSYQTWFGEGPELSLLRMLGLFDRPVSENTLAVLLKQPAISDLTESLTDFSLTEWRALLARLRRARLIAGEDPNNRGYLDTHPLVREYFGEQLRHERAKAWQEANRRLYEHYRNLAPPLPNTFREMEPLFLAVTCGCRAGLFHEALHEVYILRIQRGNALFTANVLGARGALLSVLVHFFEHGRWGSLVETDVEGQTLTAEDQLCILVHAALFLTSTRGLGAPEARICCERAEPLCHSLHRPDLLYLALMGQWRYSLVTGNNVSVALQIAKRAYSLAQEQRDPALMMGACRSLAVTLYFLGDFQSSRQYAVHGVEIWRSAALESPVGEVSAPAVVCMGVQALCQWHSGEIASSQATMAESISLAKELHDMHSLALGLYFAACLGRFEHNTFEVQSLASKLIELSTRQNFALWLAGGTVFQGWARCTSGDTTRGISLIEEGIEQTRTTGRTPFTPFLLGLKAEAMYLANRAAEALGIVREAEALVEISGERWWFAELNRLRGVFLTALGADEAQIEASFHGAINTAKEQRSISLQKRAEATYAEYDHQKASRSGGRGFRLPL